MKFPQAQAIIYITRSTHNSENIDVVKKAMEMNQEERSKQTSFYELTPALPKLAQSLMESARISNGLQSETPLINKGKVMKEKTHLLGRSLSTRSNVWRLIFSNILL